MFSNLARGLIISVSLTTFIGCGLKFGEETKKQEITGVASVECMTESMEQFKKFFAGDATSNEISEATECVQKVIISFKDNIRGQDKQSYTGPELSKFLTQKVLKNKTQLSPAFMSQFLKFKKVLLGGAEDRLTHSELVALSELLGRLKPSLANLAPHMKVVLGKWQTEGLTDELKKATFLNAKGTFKSAINDLANVLNESARAYPFEDLAGLVAEALVVVKSEPATVEKILKATRLLAQVKVTVLGGAQDIRNDEWLRLADALSEGLFVIHRLKYFAEPLSQDDQAGRLAVYQDIALDVTALIPRLMSGAGAPTKITNSQISTLLAEAKVLFPKLEVSSDLVEQIAKLKQVVLGQSLVGSTGWHISDFSKLNQKVPRLFQAASLIAENLKHYKVNAEAYRQKKIKYEDFVRAEEIIKTTVDQLSTEVSYEYSLPDLKKLVLSLKPLLGDSLKLPENLEELFQLAYAAKVTLTGEVGPQLTISNIQLIMKLGIRFYSHYVELQNFVTPFKVGDKMFTTQLEPLVGKLNQSLALMLQLKPSHKLTSAELTQLVLSAQNAKIIKTEIKSESLMTLLDGIWSNVLNTPEKRIESLFRTSENPQLGQSTTGGLNAEALQNLALEIKLWMATQKIITDIFDKKPEWSKAELLAELTKYRNAIRDPLAQLSIDELHRMVAANGFMNFNSKNYLKILTTENGRYHTYDLINSNIAKTVSRVFLRSYIGIVNKCDPSNTDECVEPTPDKEELLSRLQSMEGVTLEETKLGFDQLKFVVYDLNLIDRNNPDFMDGRFLEANTLLAVSNGDKILNFEELHHLALHTISGINRGKSLEKLALAQCLKAQNRVPMLTELDQECLLNLYNQVEEPFLGLPRFVDLRKNSTGADETKKYYLSLLMAAGHKLNPNQTVLTKDASLFPHVVQYVEAVYDRHDTNKDGVLNKEEIIVATPAFNFVIGKVFGNAFKPNLRPGVLMYMLRCGESIKLTQTTVEKLGGFVRNPHCQAVQWEKSKSTRYNVGSLLGTLSVALRSEKPQAPATPVSDGSNAPDSNDIFCNQSAPWKCFEQAQFYLDRYCQDLPIPTDPTEIPECPPPDEGFAE